MSSTDTPFRDALLAEVKDFCKAHKMSLTAFGVSAVNDPNIVRQIQAGRDIRVSTLHRLQDFMRSGQ